MRLFSRQRPGADITLAQTRTALRAMRHPGRAQQ